MNNLEKIKRQLSKPVLIKIKNDLGEEDEFYFKKLNIEQQAIMMELSKRFNSREMVEVEGKEVPDINKEDMLEMEELLLDVVKNSMPEIQEEEVLKDFVNDNFNQLSEQLINLMPENNGENTKDLIEKRKEVLRNANAE